MWIDEYKITVRIDEKYTHVDYLMTSYYFKYNNRWYIRNCYYAHYGHYPYIDWIQRHNHIKKYMSDIRGRWVKRRRDGLSDECGIPKIELEFINRRSCS